MALFWSLRGYLVYLVPFGDTWYTSFLSGASLGYPWYTSFLLASCGILGILRFGSVLEPPGILGILRSFWGYLLYFVPFGASLGGYLVYFVPLGASFATLGIYFVLALF